MRNGSNTLIVFLEWLNRLELFLLHIFYCIWCLFCFWFHFYAITLSTFVRFLFNRSDLVSAFIYRTWKVFRNFLTSTRKKTEVWRINSAILLDVKRVKALSDILASSWFWKNSKHHETGLKLNKLYLINLHNFYSWLRIFRDTLLPKLVFLNKSCGLLKCFIELYFFMSWLFVKTSFLSLCRLFQSYMNIACRSMKIMVL